MDSQELQRIKNRYGVIGNDAALNLAIETAYAMSSNDLAVLITGESGVGKDVLPQIIHQNSRRKTGKYLAVNCGSIPVGTISAELFGHEKGSFTGAIAERKGYFEEADGGTLFLDEIGELPRETQAMLLRVLQSGEYIKVGSSKVEKTDVRVVAATNVNLEHAVATGKFRQDLYYRLNAIEIKMPALRERKEDIHLLFRKFTSDFASQNGMCKIALDTDAIKVLMGYRWPGNVRQLKNFTEALTALYSRPLSPSCEKVTVDAATLRSRLPDEKDTLIPALSDGSAQGGVFTDDEKSMLIKAILDMKGDVESLKKAVFGAGNSWHSQAPSIAEHSAHTVPDTAPEDPEEVEWTDAVAAEPQSLRKAGDEMILKALERNGGNVAKAAKELGCSERNIYRKLKAWKEQK